MRKKFPVVAPMYSENNEFGGCVVFDLNTDGEPEMVGFRPAEKKYLVEVGGNLDDPNKGEVFYECETHEDRLAYLWAFCICEHPTHAWFYDPGNPGIVSNKKNTQEGWDKLPEKIKAKARQFAIEDNAICAEGGIRRRKPWISGGV